MHIILARELVILWSSVAKDSQQLPWKNRLLRLLRSCWLGSFIGLSWHPGAEVDLAHAASRDCQARHVCNLSCSEFSSHYPPRSTVAGDPGVPRPRGLGILRREAQHGKSGGSFCPLQRRRGPAFFADFLLFLAFETAARAPLRALRASLRALRAPLRAHGEPVLNVIHSPWGVVLIFQWSLYYGDFYTSRSPYR